MSLSFEQILLPAGVLGGFTLEKSGLGLRPAVPAEVQDFQSAIQQRRRKQKTAMTPHRVFLRANQN